MTIDTDIDEIRQAAARWVERLIDTDLSAEERESFQRWLTANRLHEHEFRIHGATSNLTRDLPEETRDELLALALEQPPGRGMRRKAWLSGLAAFLFTWFAREARPRCRIRER